MATVPETKVCSKCRERKPIDQFGKASDRADGHQPRCNTCRSAHRREHKEERAAYDRQWKAANPEYKSAWRREHKEERAAYVQVYYDLRPEKKERRRLGSIARMLKWAKNNTSKMRAQLHRRRARITANGGSFTGREWDTLCAFYRHRCLCCDQQAPLTIDHVIPLSLGGANGIDNIQPLCRSCNSRKKDRAIDYRDPVSFALFLSSLQGEA